MNSGSVFAGKSLRTSSTIQALVDEADRREVRHRIVERPLVERLVDAVAAEIADHDLIAVRRRARDAERAGHAARAADVLDHHLLAEDFAHALRHGAAVAVDRAAGGIRHHQRERPRRPVLRDGASRAARQGPQAPQRCTVPASVHLAFRQRLTPALRTGQSGLSRRATPRMTNAGDFHDDTHRHCRTGRHRPRGGAPADRRPAGPEPRLPSPPATPARRGTG